MNLKIRLFLIICTLFVICVALYGVFAHFQSVHASATFSKQLDTLVTQTDINSAVTNIKREIDQSMTQLVFEGLGLLAAMGMVVAILIFLVISYLLRPLDTLAQTMRSISATGELSRKAPEKGDIELVMLAREFNQLSSQVAQTVDAAQQTLNALANGNYTVRMSGQYVGALSTLEQSIRLTAEALNEKDQLLINSMTAIRQGELRVNPETPTVIRQAVEQINHFNEQICNAIQKVSIGDFSAQIEGVGDFAQTASEFTNSMQTLQNSLEDIGHAIDSLSSGNMTYRVKSHPGYLGELGKNINKSFDVLSNTLNNVQHEAEELNHQSLQLSDAASLLQHANQQVGHSLESANNSRIEMIKQVDMMIDQLNSMNMTTDQNISFLQTMTQNMNQSVSAVRRIQETSTQISEIISLVDSISFQTNLLALNAAVEAARAGEHGRGFAVVASEVRALAAKSAEAAQDIRALIDRSVTQVNEGVTMIEHSANTLAQIDGATQKMISTVSMVQSGASTVQHAVTQTSAALADVSHQATVLHQQVEALEKVSTNISRQSEVLDTNVSHFKTR